MAKIIFLVIKPRTPSWLKKKPQRASLRKLPTPKILTLKVDLSFASSATNFEDIIALLDRPQLTVPAKAEAPDKANKAAAGGGNPLPPGP